MPSCCVKKLMLPSEPGRRRPAVQAREATSAERQRTEFSAALEHGGKLVVEGGLDLAAQAPDGAGDRRPDAGRDERILDGRGSADIVEEAANQGGWIGTKHLGLLLGPPE